MDYIWLVLAVFLASLAGVFWMRRSRTKEGEVGAQLVVTGFVLVIFYSVCFLSGVCTILNFIWRWVL